MFITFEGPDGSGKSTQHKMLAEYLKNKTDKTIVTTREPGGTNVGKKIRELLLKSSKGSICDLTELLLFASDRAQHIAEIIMPAIKRSDIVLCDRYIDSTYAYQVGGRGLDKNLVAKSIDIATEGLLPDVTFLFDVDSKIGLDRAEKTGSADRMEQESLNFHNRVRSAYLELADKHKRFIVIDTSSLNIEQTHKKVLEYLPEIFS